MSFLSKAIVVAGAMAFACPAFASNILVSAYPWEEDRNYTIENMKDVFGSDFETIDSYAAIDVGTVFSPANSFVLLEGSGRTDLALATFLKTNTAPISSWVSAGGHLMIQSAGEHVPNDVTFAGVTLSRTPVTPNRGGTLTAAGEAVYTAFYMPPYPSGASLAEDVITGSGLTVLMTGNENGGAIVAGRRYGRGTILFSGLTDSEFHYPGPGGLLGDTNEVLDNTIAVAASGAGLGAVPLPASASLFGAALLALAGVRRGAAAVRRGHARAA